ncbi:hypothetical protein HU200_038066 [Digitaria exilis]|uniref:Uncharacterized protein n=1 Tax=Digitaria exilis TaxID=1010633 RepID=A0A835EMF2_9POAL|nr:hypothetical protein HU200_038066 [Digitaria exilis]
MGSRQPGAWPLPTASPARMGGREKGQADRKGAQRNFAVVVVRGFRDVNVGIFHRKLKSVPRGEACVVGRNVSGDLIAKSVELSGDLRVYKDDKDLDSKTSKAWEVVTSIFLCSFEAPVGGKSNSHPEGRRDNLPQEHLDIDSMGYPKLPPTMLDEPFGDMHGKGVWSKLGKKAHSRINRSVVALASFNDLSVASKQQKDKWDVRAL